MPLVRGATGLGLKKKKTFAVGARCDEIPLAPPDAAFVSLPNKPKAPAVTTPADRRVRRKVFRQLPGVALNGFAPICLDSNDPLTVKCGFEKRVLRRVPEPSPQILAEFKNFVTEYVKKNIPIVDAMPFEEWLASTSYNEARKNELRGAHDALKGGLPTRYQCRKINSFVKTEGYDCYKHCRLINSRCDAFKVFSGPMFKAIENVVYDHSFGEDDSRVRFIKHIPVPERPSCISALKQAGVHYYQTDFTAFESHFTRGVMEACELALYRHCLQNNAGCGLLCRTIEGLNRMKTRSGVGALSRARRMSGDMCTSLGNGFTNLMLARFLASRKGGRLSGFVEGDDGIFATDFPLKSEDYEELGFTIKCEEVADPCHASFCGMVFASSGQILRNPRRFLANFGWTSTAIHGGDRIMGELLRAKGLSACYETPHCPVVGVLARRALAMTRGFRPRFVEDGYHRIPTDETNIPDFQPTIETRELFARLYGVPIPLQLELERALEAGDMSRAASIYPSVDGGENSADMQHYFLRYVETV